MVFKYIDIIYYIILYYNFINLDIQNYLYINIFYILSIYIIEWIETQSQNSDLFIIFKNERKLFFILIFKLLKFKFDQQIF